ncbi:MAG: glycosyl transferase [Bacteroidaceae bacterium]|nr:glycosyl transferase [Bacteroidaceae bacterium]
MTLSNIIHTIFHPTHLASSVLFKTAKFWTSDELYLKALFLIRTKRVLNLKNPTTFNEKLQWLKLHDRQPLYSQLVDKYAVKQIVSERIGEKYVIPLLGVWENPEDINWESLPNEFVLKTTNGGGNTGVVICEDKTTIDKRKAIERLQNSLNIDIYLLFREWPYKNIKGKIIAEELIKSKEEEIRDYKFYCFHGEPQFVAVASERFSGKGPYFDYFDMKGNKLLLEQGGKNNPNTPKLPLNYSEMQMVAKKLSQGIPHVRLDLFSVNGKIYFGEYTFFDASGLDNFHPKKWDRVFGDYLILPSKSNSELYIV